MSESANCNKCGISTLSNEAHPFKMNNGKFLCVKCNRESTDPCHYALNSICEVCEKEEVETVGLENKLHELDPHFKHLEICKECIKKAMEGFD